MVVLTVTGMCNYKAVQIRCRTCSLPVLTFVLCVQHVSDFFVTSANAALSKSDEPEKVSLRINCPDDA